MRHCSCSWQTKEWQPWGAARAASANRRLFYEFNGHWACGRIPFTSGTLLFTEEHSVWSEKYSWKYILLGKPCKCGFSPVNSEWHGYFRFLLKRHNPHLHWNRKATIPALYAAQLLGNQWLVLRHRKFFVLPQENNDIFTNAILWNEQVSLRLLLSKLPMPVWMSTGTHPDQGSSLGMMLGCLLRVQRQPRSIPVL